MKLNYSLDISQKSTWYVNTPNIISKRLPFYINEYGHYIASSDYFTERQGQQNYLLLYTLSGSGILKYIDQEFTLTSNQAVLIFCDNYHFYKTISKEPWNFKWIHFNGISAKEYFELLNEESLSIININNPSSLEESMDNLNMYFDAYDIPSIINISTLLSNILSILISSKFSQDNNKKYTEHRLEVEKVINYIQLNYNNKITLDDLTKIAYLSKYYFLRIFKMHTGISPYEYLMNYRINKAKELLISTNFSVGEICESVGFPDYDNFIRAFKKIVGVTPMNYKKHSNIKY